MQSRCRLLLFSNSTQYGHAYLEHAAKPIKEYLGDRVQKIVFVPFASGDWVGYEVEAKDAFRSFGYELESIHASKEPEQAIGEAEAIFVGGGNTFRLLKALQNRDLTKAIRRRVESGTPYIGASAGSNIACPTIKTTNDMPIVEPASFAALHLLPFQINAHYLDPDPDSRHQGETREVRIKEFHEENTTPVLGIREGTWLRREGDGLTFHGSAGARLFRRSESPEDIVDGTDLSGLLARQ